MIKKLEFWISVLKNYRDNASEKAVEAAIPHERFVVELNANQMFVTGKDSKGADIRPRYAASTVAYKRRRGQPTNRVTLRDTGDFHDSLFANFDGDEITIGADDDKAPRLFKKYGKDVLGLDRTSMDALAEVVRPDLIKKFRADLGV